MKAALINAYGSPEVIEIADIPVPTIEADEVLIRVAAGSFNPADIAIRAGALKEMIPVSFPYVLGADAAGVVEQVGSDVKNLEVGDEVFTYVNFFKQGSLSEFIAAKASEIAPAPKSLPLVDAAALPAVGLTAWQALFVHADLQPGQRVAIFGASGGVGSMAVQLAKWKGAFVIGLSSAKHQDFVKSIGADLALDYGAADLKASIGAPLDAIINVSPAPADVVTGWLSLLKPDGVLVSAASPADTATADRLGVRAMRMASQRNGDQLVQLAKLADEGRLKPAITARCRLEDVAKLHAAGGSAYGKVVITVDETLGSQ